MLPNAVAVWNTLWIGDVVAGLRAGRHVANNQELARTSLLLHALINPFGQHRFNLTQMRGG